MFYSVNAQSCRRFAAASVLLSLASFGCRSGASGPALELGSFAYEGSSIEKGGGLFAGEKNLVNTSVKERLASDLEPARVYVKLVEISDTEVYGGESIKFDKAKIVEEFKQQLSASLDKFGSFSCVESAAEADLIFTLRIATVTFWKDGSVENRTGQSAVRDVTARTMTELSRQGIDLFVTLRASRPDGVKLFATNIVGRVVSRAGESNDGIGFSAEDQKFEGNSRDKYTPASINVQRLPQAVAVTSDACVLVTMERLEKRIWNLDRDASGIRRKRPQIIG